MIQMKNLSETRVFKCSECHRLAAYGTPTTYSVSSSSPSIFCQSSKDFLEMRIMLPMRIVLNRPEFASL